jgi:hypothetical protein
MTSAPATSMHRRIGRFSAGILALAFAFSGCAYMSKTGRQQMAYQHYLSKHMRQNQRRIARAQKKANRDLKRKLKFIHPSEPIISATVDSAAPTSDPSAPSPQAPGEKADGLTGP